MSDSDIKAFDFSTVDPSDMEEVSPLSSKHRTLWRGRGRERGGEERGEGGGRGETEGERRTDGGRKGGEREGERETERGVREREGGRRRTK